MKGRTSNVASQAHKHTHRGSGNRRGSSLVKVCTGELLKLEKKVLCRREEGGCLPFRRHGPARSLACACNVAPWGTEKEMAERKIHIGNER